VSPMLLPANRADVIAHRLEDDRSLTGYAFPMRHSGTLEAAPHDCTRRDEPTFVHTTWWAR